MRALVCLGDKTTYGEVISATATWLEGNKAIAQTGDLAQCSKCKGAFPIFGTAFDWSEHQPYAATGDRVLCGCPDHVVYGSTTQYTTVASSLIHVNAHASSFSAPASGSKSFARSFSITDSDTGRPLANRAYIVLVDGHRKAGLTDSNGIATVEARTTDSVITLHVVFQAPARELTEFSEEVG